MAQRQGREKPQKRSGTLLQPLEFYSFADLQEQMKRYLRRSNNIPMAVLGWKSPNQKQKELEDTWA